MPNEEIATIAALIDDPTRAKILIALMAGRALTAGELGVKVSQALIRFNYILLEDEKYKLSNSGENFFAELGIDYQYCQTLRRKFIKPCLDWTEREYHLAGNLGAQLLDYFFYARFILRSKIKPRVILLTPIGRQWLERELKIIFS